MGAQNLPWWKAIGELVDNSFDAKATRVAIKCVGRTVNVSDDGHGMPDIAVAITIGGHRKHDQDGLGAYGVGLKDAWRSAGERIEVATVRSGVRSRLDFSIESIQLHDRTWKLPKPTTEFTGEKSGTTIVLHLREGKNKPGSDAWEMLAWAFTPALSTDGRQIVQGNDRTVKPLVACKFPALSEAVAETFDVHGKQVTIRIGIMAPGERIFKGPFWVQYKHRNIVGSSIGVGEYSDDHLAGTIVLGDGWKLTKNKDDFDDHKEELADAINARIKPLLIKAATISQDIESTALTATIAGMLNAAIANNKREKRAALKETSGTVTPVASGKKRRRAKKVSDLPGDVRGGDSKLPRRGFTLGWYADENDVVGQYDYHANRIKLNIAHQFVKQLKEAKNTLGLYSIAAAVLSDHHCMHDGPSRLLVPDKEFSRVFSAVTKQIGGGTE